MSDDIFLEVDADTLNAPAEQVAAVLEGVAETLRDAPPEKRYNLELTVDEHE